MAHQQQQQPSAHQAFAPVAMLNAGLSVDVLESDEPVPQPRPRVSFLVKREMESAPCSMQLSSMELSVERRECARVVLAVRAVLVALQ
jgi:hypothetical protein